MFHHCSPRPEQYNSSDSCLFAMVIDDAMCMYVLTPLSFDVKVLLVGSDSYRSELSFRSWWSWFVGLFRSWWSQGVS